MSFSLAEINEAIAAVIPEREAIVTASRRLTWRDLQMRTRRLANLLIDAGLGCRRERDSLAPWESGQDHVALYLYNGNEYVEGMLGAYKARAVPFNVNYRYVEEELHYLLADAATRGVIYHASFAPILAKVLPRLPEMAILLQVDDGSGEPLLPGARDYEQALAEASDERPAVRPSEDDLYIVYTGGTTGMPKGVMWRQRDIFFAAMGGRLPGGSGEVGSVDEMVERAPNGELLRLLPAPPFMHGASQWSSFIILHQGGTVVLPSNPRRLDPHDIWRTVEKERVVTMSIVGDAFARPLLDQLRKQKYDLSSLQILGSGGAILSPSLKKALLEAIPHVILFDGFGSSETGAQGSSMSTAGAETPSAFRMDEHTLVLDESLQRPSAARRAARRLAGARRVPTARLPERPGEDRADVPDDRRRALRGARRPRAGDGGRPDHRVRTRLRVHQHRRREGVRRGGRAGPQASRGGVRRRRHRDAERALGPAGDGGRGAAPGRARQRGGAARDGRSRAGALQAAEGLRLRRLHRPLRQRQARLPLGEGDGGEGSNQ